MADIGQSKDALGIKIQEVKIRIRQKEASIFNLETERMATQLNLKRLENRLGEFDGNIAEIQRQIEADQKDLASLEGAFDKAK